MADEKNRDSAAQQVEDLRNNDTGGGESCGAMDFTCKASDATNGILDEWTEKVKLAAEGFVEMMFTGPLQLDTMTGFLSFPLVENALSMLAQYGLGFALIVFAGTLIFNQSRANMKKWGLYAFRVMIVTGGAWWIGSQLIQASDGYSKWIIDQATPNQEMADTILSTLAVTGPAGVLIGLFVLLFVAFVTFWQGILLVSRFFGLPIIGLFAPVVVTMSFTRIGMNWWTHLLTLWIALLLYKPVAATIYAFGFEGIGAGNVWAAQSLPEAGIAGVNLIGGVVIVLLATMSLKWMLSVAAPITGQIEATVSGGAMTAAAVSTAATMATGAVGRAIGGVSSTASSTGVTPVNSHAKGADAPTGSVGNPQSGPGRAPSGWDTPATGSTGTAQSGPRGPQGPAGGAGMPGNAPAASQAPTGAVGTPNSKPSSDARKII